MARLLRNTIPGMLGLALALPMAGSADAQKIYKYVDKDGNTVYTQSPPRGIKAQTIEPKVVKVDPAEAAARLKALDERARRAGETRRQRGQIAAEDAEAEKRERENCEQARKNLGILNGSALVQSTDANGNVVALTDEAKADKRAQAEAQIKRYCR